MSKEICISSTPHETRLAILENDQLAEIYYERENEYTLAGSIYKGRVTRVLPGMQSAFVDIGLERDAFLYVTDFLEEQEESADFERIGAPPLQRVEEKGRAPESQGVDETSEQAPEGTRRWKGRRGQRGRDHRPQQAHEGNGHRIESPEAVEESIAAEPVPLPEHGAPGGIPAAHFPILLPGESLSKYGGKPAAAPEKPTTPNQVYTLSKPSTLIEGPIEWSGGDLLPGESRAWRSVQAEQNVPAGEAAAIVPEVPEIYQEEATAAFPEAAVPETQELATEAAAHEPTQEITHQATYVPEQHEEPVEHVEEVHEYEPEHAEASHRVDITSPREFRIPGDVEEAEAAAPEVTEQHVVPETVTEEAASAQPEYEVEYQEEDQTAAQEQNATAPEVETTHHAHEFSPGAGLLEEEVIDEDEYDFEPLQAHAEEQDFEDLEEETLQHEVNGTDLGAMVRDLHINQRVNFGPEGALAQETEEEEYPAESAEAEDIEEEVEEEEETGERPQDQGHVQRERRRGRGRHGRRRHTGGMRRSTAQVTDLPAITELLKPGQEILVQIAKEPIAKKGARITSHIALPGRFLVFMPTVNHVGVSRKISSDDERYRLKRVLISEKGAASGGFIVRTAAEGASEEELRADLRFLINLWNDIKQRSDDAKAPALIYHDLNLVERVLRDQVSESFSTIWVDSESEYERVVRFLNRFQPSLVRRVKLYTKETPLFEQFGIQDEISKALKSKVWLKSGGSIVINQTEALVAIDINTGKYVGKTARLEDTILKTNLDAIPEIVRQIRLRDLGGIIVIDFIDMDERKNRQKVMQALEEELKNDRAPSKVLQFNDFGLVAITRKRVKQSLERTLSVPCYICTGTGMVKSPITVCNEIYIEMRKMQKHLERNDVLLRVHPEVVKTLKANNARWLNEMEEMTGKTIIVKSDPALHPEQFDIH
jgi:Rne/Rng family ribonuclease